MQRLQLCPQRRRQLALAQRVRLRPPAALAHAPRVGVAEAKASRRRAPALLDGQHELRLGVVEATGGGRRRARLLLPAGAAASAAAVWRRYLRLRGEPLVAVAAAGRGLRRRASASLLGRRLSALRPVQQAIHQRQRLRWQVKAWRQLDRCLLLLCRLPCCQQL